MSQMRVNKLDDEMGEEEYYNENHTQQQPEMKRVPMQAAPKIGRNDLCPCGSGKKFKACHGKGMN